MKKYVVGFTISDVRNLVTEDGGPCDPFVLVECCGRKWQSTTKEEKIGLVPWNESSIWPDITLHPEEFESAYIEFSVFARHWWTRNYLIGKASMQLESVNRRKGFVYAKKPVALRREGVTNSTGTLTVTVYCLKPGEAPPSDAQQQGAEGPQGEEQPEDFEDLSKAVLGQVDGNQGKPYHVNINIYRVEDLAKINGSFPSPFVTVEFAGACVQTEPASNVELYTWNACARIPVTIPVFEDTILIKLWSRNTLSADELLAQGLISFSELRNNSLPPRWFCLYGWDPDEVPDVKKISNQGETVKPNFFKGRLLISGRVDRLKDPDDMCPAENIPARPAVEPQTLQVALLADVYEVCGADGRECQVQLAFGKEKRATKQWVTPYRGPEKSSSTPSSAEPDDDFGDESHKNVQVEDVTQFSFSQVQGRIDPMLIMTPEENESQPFVMVNVYTRGVLSPAARVGYQMMKILDIPRYEPGSPAKPKYITLDPMPNTANQRLPASVLMTIEQFNTDDVARHNRKYVKLMSYIIRAYVFMARGIRSDLSNYACRVSCAGVSKTTDSRDEVRPTWMLPLELKVTLSSDHPREPPTMEPITVTIVGGTQVTIRGRKDICKTVCKYEYMRRKDNMQKWEPYTLKPQWIKLYGGQYGSIQMGEVLIAFELLQWKSRNDPALYRKDMWPVPELEYEKSKHFTKLKKATLHFALYGLRDIKPSGAAMGSEKQDLLVTVRVKKFSQEAQTQTSKDGKIDKYFNMSFEYKDLVDNGERNSKWDLLHKWRSDSLGVQGCWNYEFFQVKKMRIEVPEESMLEPFIAVRVHEKPSYVGKVFGSEGTLIGEHRMGLAKWYPVCWYPNISLEKSYKDQADMIEKEVDNAIKRARSKAKFEEESQEAREKVMQEERIRRFEERKKQMSGGRIEPDEEVAEEVNSAAMPLELREFHDVTNPYGYAPHEREKLNFMPLHKLNMMTAKSFKEMLGEQSRSKEDTDHPMLPGKLEDCTDTHIFDNDLFFKSKPLFRNRDALPDKDATDWNFRYSETYGFVKCMFKLVDGWEDDEEGDEELAPSSSVRNNNQDKDLPLATDDEADAARLRRSFGIDPETDSTVFDQKKFQKGYKSKEHVPSRIRVRLYFVKAVCIAGKGTPLDPYLAFKLGSNIQVSMRNMPQRGTNSPSFYRTEERDIEMPVESQLKVDVWDYQDVSQMMDTLIGSTVIDLEDRWHSKEWRKADARMRLPMENRPLCNADLAGQTCGSLLMWVEMIDASKASDRKLTVLAPPAPNEIELRMVIWTTKGIKIVDGDHTDVKVGVDLECQEYQGHKFGYPKFQVTDIHLGSVTGDAVFNWRIVFPNIVLPTVSCTIDIKVYDANLTFADTFIGGVTVDLKRYMEHVAKTMDPIESKADIPFQPPGGQQAPTEEEGGGEEGGGAESLGSVQFTMWIMTQPEADNKRANKGREEPNDFPQLVTPTEGRGWGDVFALGGFALPSFGIWKKLLPPIIFTLFCLVLLRWLGLL